MIASRFWENFPNIANAPNGVIKLRELVLCLAMQGKLVEQNPDDTPAEELLVEVEAEKESLVREQKLKAPKELLSIRENERRYPLPKTWEWVRFGTIALHNSGKTLDQQRNRGQLRDYITTSNLYWGRFDLRNLRKMLIEDDELDRCTAAKGDLLICEGGEAGRAAVWESDREVSFQNHVHRARFYAKIDPYYAFRFFQKLSATGEINLYRKGVGISSMSGKVLASIAFPLPPVAEQKRIVAKVDELMALCDQLEAQQQERNRGFPILSRALHARFAEAPTPANLDRIFDETGEVDPADLRKTVLALAVQGKLVSQDSKDESTEELFAAIQQTKRDLIAAKDIPAQPKLPPIEAADIVFEVPASWKWARLGDIYINSFYGPRFGKGEYDPKGIPTIRTTDMTEKGKILLRNPPRVRVGDEKLALYELRENDLLLTRSGTIGMMAVFKGEYVAIPSAYLIRFRFSTHVSADFYYLFLSSPYGQDMLGLSQRSIGVPNVNATSISYFPAPIPPLAEQLRIVAKVNELMTLVDQLEAQQKERDKLAETFAKACVASFTGTTQLERPEKMKVPKTELVSLVSLGKKKPKPNANAQLANLLVNSKGELPAKSLWQQSGLTIDAFYQQLKTEIAAGWIAPPAEAEMKILGDV